MDFSSFVKKRRSASKKPALSCVTNDSKPRRERGNERLSSQIGCHPQSGSVLDVRPSFRPLSVTLQLIISSREHESAAKVSFRQNEDENLPTTKEHVPRTNYTSHAKQYTSFPHTFETSWNDHAIAASFKRHKPSHCEHCNTPAPFLHALIRSRFIVDCKTCFGILTTEKPTLGTSNTQTTSFI